jgi:hypothetical protein
LSCPWPRASGCSSSFSKRSIIGGLLSLFLGFPVLYFLVTGWGKEGQDIKKPSSCPSSLGHRRRDRHVVAKEFVDLTMPQEPVQPVRPTPPFRDPTPPDSIRINETPAAPAAPSPRPVTVTQPAPEPRMPAQRTEPARTIVREAPRPSRPAQSNCVYKPVMTDEDMAKCR